MKYLKVAIIYIKNVNEDDEITALKSKHLPEEVYAKAIIAVNNIASIGQHVNEDGNISEDVSFVELTNGNKYLIKESYASLSERFTKLLTENSLILN